MSELCLGKCEACVPAQVLLGTMRLDVQQREASGPYDADEVQQQAWRDYFNSRPEGSPPLGGLRGDVYATADEFAAAMTRYVDKMSAARDARAADRERRFQEVVTACAGIMSCTVEVIDGSPQAIDACASLEEISAIQREPN